MIKTFLLTVLFLALTTAVQANDATFTDNSNIEDGFVIEMLAKGAWVEVMTLPPSTVPAPSQVSFKDALTEGVYRVAAYLTVPGGGRLVSSYSNVAGKIRGPINLTVP